MTKIDYWAIMTRRKQFLEEECVESKLGRVFGTFDLTALGVSATLGVGVYVLAGHVAKDQAGPSVILSFLIAAIASFLAGKHCNELSSRRDCAIHDFVYSFCIFSIFKFEACAMLSFHRAFPNLAPLTSSHTSRLGNFSLSSSAGT